MGMNRVAGESCVAALDGLSLLEADCSHVWGTSLSCGLCFIKMNIDGC